MVAVVLAVAAGSLEEPPRIQVFGSLVDVRPGVQPPTRAAASGASLFAARNEFESFQIAVESDSSPLTSISVAKDGALTGPGGARIAPANLALYREAYYNVNTPSDREGARGPWPDPLIPVRDDLYGERRDAFPATAPAGGDVVAWVDVYVPAQQRPGVYRGEVTVSVAGGPARSVPVRLRVLPFKLPSTSSLRSAFGLDASQACEVLGGDDCGASSAAAWAYQYMFAREALENRLTISDPTPTGELPPTPGAQARLFRRYALPLIEGGRRSPIGGPPPRLTGARLTASAALGASYASGDSPPRYGCAAPDSPCLGRWRRLAGRDGFAGRMFIYLCDEPWVDPAQRWPVCKKAASGVADGAWPRLPRLVTTWIQDARANRGAWAIDTITVPLEQLADKPGFVQNGNQRPAYARFLRRPGRSLWLYTFCDQYGCRESPTPGAYWTGWPGYGIDQPPSQAQAMGWLAFEYGASGELYYSVDAAFGSAWDDTYSFGGNGGGTLFYPGLPGGDAATGAPAIGGRQSIPLQSMRLKRLRDGRQDYEYLLLAAERGHPGRATAVSRWLVGGRDVAAFNATFSQPALTHARCRLARLIAPAIPPGCV